MKKLLYKLAYRAVSLFSDWSGGSGFFVKWKAALAVVIIGVSTTTFSSCVSCYDPADPPSEEQTETRYDNTAESPEVYPEINVQL